MLNSELLTKPRIHVCMDWLRHEVTEEAKTALAALDAVMGNDAEDRPDEWQTVLARCEVFSSVKNAVITKFVVGQYYPRNDDDDACVSSNAEHEHWENVVRWWPLEDESC